MALADALDRLQEEAICPICLEYISEPISIDCGHNFCQRCITRHCQEKGVCDDEPFSCPQCRATCHRSGFRPNHQLANIVENIRQLELRDTPRPQPEPGALLLLCPQHHEPLKLFCEEDEEPICVVCRESQHHRPHTVYPIEEAAQVYKVKLQKSLENLLKEAEEVKKHESSLRTTTQKFKETVKKTRERIVSEFGKLHRLLVDEEKMLLQTLEEEEKETLARIGKDQARLMEEKCLVENLILEIREKSQKPADELLKDMKSILSRCEGVKIHFPVCVTLRDNYRIPEHCLSMRDMLKKYRADILLDPETAHPDLIVSEDRKSVRRGSKKLLLPHFDNGRRFLTTPVVLGSPNFAFDRHYWEVQVGDKPEWGLGMCQEPVSRKGTIPFTPNNGYWVLRLQNGGNYEALTSPVSPLSLKVRPRCVGIFLDYRAGEISFYNVSDRSHIYTFIDKFVGNLRPFFFLGGFLGGRNAEPMVISWVGDMPRVNCKIL